MKQSFIFLLSFFLLNQTYVVHAKFLTYGKWPDDVVRLKLVSVANHTESMEFQIYYNYDSCAGFIAPNSTFNFLQNQEIGIAPGNLLIIKCSKGPFKSVYIQDSGYLASGEKKDGYQGPYVISMWLSEPQVAESKKVNVRYWLKSGTIGKIGVNIGKQGDYRLVAHENVIFIE